MKWMLIILVFETAPVKTDLIFDTLGECLSAEEEVRMTYTRAFNAQSQRDMENTSPDDYQQWIEFLRSRLSRNPATCIPHAPVPQ